MNKKRKKRNIEHGKFILADPNKQNNQQHNIIHFPSFFYYYYTHKTEQTRNGTQAHDNYIFDIWGQLCHPHSAIENIYGGICKLHDS